MIILRDMPVHLRDILDPLRDLPVPEDLVNHLRELISFTEVILLKDPEGILLRGTPLPDLFLFANFVGLIDITWNHVNTMKSVRSVKALTM